MYVVQIYNRATEEWELYWIAGLGEWAIYANRASAIEARDRFYLKYVQERFRIARVMLGDERE